MTYVTRPASYSFTVPGKARPQGSKNPYVNQHTGKVHLVESSKTLAPWRETVAIAARQGWPEEMPPWQFAVGLSVTFWFRRPASHFGSGRNRHVRKTWSDEWPTSQGIGDLDKLERAICDALTGVVFLDDKQVCTITSAKLYGGRERAEVTVAALGAPLADTGAVAS